MPREKSVLITGGFGFIGRHLSALLSKDRNVTILDIAEPKRTGHKFIKADLLNPDTIPDISDYDAVVHLAAMVGVGKTEQNPRATLDVNIDGTRNILDACRKCDVKKIIFPSSSEVYGEPMKVPISETDFFNPVSAYGVSKIVGEEYVRSFSKMYGIDFNTFRLFSAYGPGQSEDFVIPRFVKLALAGKPLTVHGDGKQVRAFCYVGDVVDAMRIGLEKTKNDVFNIGNSKEPITVRELAEKIIKLTGSKSDIVRVSKKESGRGRKRDIINRIPDTRKAKRDLEFEAKTKLDDGILKVAESIRGS